VVASVQTGNRPDAETVQALVFYLLVIVVFFVSLETAHVPFALVAVLGGTLAFGIGFGSQNLVANFISGIILLFERPIQTGDLRTVDGMIGTVKIVGLRCTTISITDGKSVLVPNHPSKAT